MATRTKSAKKRPQRSERRTTKPPERRWLWPVVAAALLVALGVGLVVVLAGGDEPSGGLGGANGDAVAGLPPTPDYHSLIVAADDANGLTLGTHDGIFQSQDGGRTWVKTALSGQDAMNLGRAGGGVLWTAGHNVYARSEDGGQTWQPVEPEGRPHLDIHGFAIDPSNPQLMYAAVAGQGLYRSEDGGQSYELVSRDVGPAVMALSVTADGRLLAGDMQQGLVVSEDGGQSWQQALAAGLLGLAVNPDDPRRILAAGQPGVLLSVDGGQTWDEVLPLGEAAGPVAWAPSAPEVAYVVGFDGVLYKSDDGGESWQPVGGEGS